MGRSGGSVNWSALLASVFALAVGAAAHAQTGSVAGSEPAGAAADPGAGDTPAVPPADTPPPPRWGSLVLGGREIPPGERRHLKLEGASEDGIAIVALRGVEPGPTLCVTAGIHGDELNGVAIARRIADETDPARLRGSLVVAPIVNAHGFRNGSRYLPDRRDLNRFFPGRQRGNAASRIARDLFDHVIRRCEFLVDLHTGSLNRANLPQVRADLRELSNLRVAWGFGVGHVVHSVGPQGTLRRAAGDAGIAAVLYEAGEPMRFQPAEIEGGVRGLHTLMASLGMTIGVEPAPVEQHHYHRTRWVRADVGGIYIPAVELGQEVRIGTALAEIRDPFSSKRTEVHSPRAGRILGMAVGQVVIPGFALFHIGIEDREGGPLEEGNGQAPVPGPEPAHDPMRAELIGERPE